MLEVVRGSRAIRFLEKNPRVGLWLAFALFVFGRFPLLFFNPAPYAEEGNVYFRFAVEHGTWEALTASHLGYYALLPNVATCTAALVPLKAAPWVTLAFGMLGPSACAHAIIRAHPERMSARTKLVSIALIVFTVTMRAEWIPTIHSQFWFAVALVLSLGATTPGTRLGPFDLALVGLAAATGVVSCLLAPVFALAAIFGRDRRLGVQAIVLTFGLVAHSVGGASRAPTWPLAQFAVVLPLKLVLYPLVGKLGDGFGRVLFDHAHTALVSIGAVVCTVSWAAFGFRVAPGRWRWTVAAALWLGALSIYFALPPYGALANALWGARYALAGVVPFHVALAVGGASAPRPLRSVVDSILVLALVAGVVSGIKQTRDQLLELSSFTADVEAFETDRGVTLDLHVPRCKVSINAREQRAGFTVGDPQPTSSQGLRIALRTGHFDNNARVGLFVLAVAAASDLPRVVLGRDGWVEHELTYYGDGAFVTPGLCYGIPHRGRVAPRSVVRGGAQVVLEFSREELLALPAGARGIYVGYGRDFADALAKGTFRYFERGALVGAARGLDLRP